jgi:hypothetical protein
MKRLLWAVAAVALAPSAAHAANQGSLGSTSQGDITITASVQARVRITGLADVTWTNQDPGTAATNAQDVCVWSNTSNKRYNITATGDGSSSAFTLASGALTVPYSVEWNSSAGQTSGTALAASTASGTLTSTASNQTCTAGESASLVVGIGTTDLQSMEASASYTGVLTLVVAPV